MLGWKRLIWRDYTIRWQEVEPHLYLLSMMWTWLEANPIGLAPCLFPMWCRLFGTTLLRLLIRCFMDKTTSLYISKKKRRRCFTDKTKTKKRFADTQLHFFLPFPFICMIVLTYFFLQNMCSWPWESECMH